MGGDDDLYSELEWRGMVHQSTSPDLQAKLASESFTAYVGFDATADSLHVGHLVGIVALQRLQRAGHRPIALLGGGTSLIGDPSFKAEERQLLSAAEIEANAAGIRRQLERLLDFGPGPGQAVLADNADWLCQLPLTQFLRDVGRHFTVNTMIAKESVRARLTERDQGISYTEFSYMLLQAYDFLHLFDNDGCRLQLGGSDQWGNITAGIDLVRRCRGAEVYGLTWPLLTKADGTKFGKTEGGNVWLDPVRTSPYQFFQFWVRTDDRDVGRLLRLLTSLGRDEIERLESAVIEQPRDREAQQALAMEVTTAVHGREEAERARRAAQALFSGALATLDEAALLAVFAEAPSTDMEASTLDGGGLLLIDVLASTGVTRSKSAARGTIIQGGISVNGVPEPGPERRLGPADLLVGSYVVLRKGKRDYHLLRFQ
ncbi:MAG: tyrosine--tRNA ligase [Acidimicrobiales bacterium]